MSQKNDDSQTNLLIELLQHRLDNYGWAPPKYRRNKMVIAKHFRSMIENQDFDLTAHARGCSVATPCYKCSFFAEVRSSRLDAFEIIRLCSKIAGSDLAKIFSRTKGVRITHYDVRYAYNLVRATLIHRANFLEDFAEMTKEEFMTPSGLALSSYLDVSNLLAAHGLVFKGEDRPWIIESADALKDDDIAALAFVSKKLGIQPRQIAQ